MIFFKVVTTQIFTLEIWAALQSFTFNQCDLLIFILVVINLSLYILLLKINGSWSVSVILKESF